MKTADYCRAAKRALGNVSDYALAKHLGLPKQTISKYVNGELVLNNTSAAKIAAIIKWDPLTVIADCELERGSSPDLWKKLRDAAVWAAVALGAASFGVPQDARAAFDITPSCAASGASRQGVTFAPGMRQKYTLRRIRRRVAGGVLGRLLAWLALL